MKLPKGYKICVFKNCPEVKEFICENDPSVDFLDLVIKASSKVSYIYYYNQDVIGVSLAKVVRNEGVEFYECMDSTLPTTIIDAIRFKVYRKRFRTNVFTHSPINNS